MNRSKSFFVNRWLTGFLCLSLLISTLSSSTRLLRGAAAQGAPRLGPHIFYGHRGGSRGTGNQIDERWRRVADRILSGGPCGAREDDGRRGQHTRDPPGSIAADRSCVHGRSN